MTELPQYVREALSEIIGAISDSPKGSEIIMGRAFDVISGPITDLVMDVCGGDREEIEQSAAELRACRASLRSMGS